MLCPHCDAKLPAETAMNGLECYFCGGQLSQDSPEPMQKGGVTSVTKLDLIPDKETSLKTLYAQISLWFKGQHQHYSWREMARQMEVDDDQVDSVAAQLSAIANGSTTKPAILRMLGLIPKTELVAVCPIHNEVHDYDCREQSTYNRKRERTVKRNSKPRKLPDDTKRFAAYLSSDKFDEITAEARELDLTNGEYMAHQRQRVIDLADALEELMTWQNGPPLVTYEENWMAAMNRARELIGLIDAAGEE